MRLIKGSIAPAMLCALAFCATGCSQPAEDDVAFELKSLTGSDFAGKKYYLGWGEVLDGFMGNETKYDVKHTHDIFTTGAGGTYTPTVFGQNGQSFGGQEVVQKINELTGQATEKDMYVQYSSGHGYNGGLGIGLEYSSVVNAAMKTKAKEVVIFTMACYSGSEVEAFEQQKSQWQSWAQQGRTLFVMSSSTSGETSSTGPGTDAQEASGPEGSAGSAYGHALWKTLTGEADGYLDGVKDGFISLGEIAAYATKKTQEVGNHTPQVTGVYNPQLIMNKVPGKTWVASQTGGTNGMTDEQIRAAVKASDERDAAQSQLIANQSQN